LRGSIFGCQKPLYPVKIQLAFPEFGKLLKKGGSDVQLLAIYLLTAPSSTMTGLYYLAKPTAAHELAMSLKRLEAALSVLVSNGFCKYDKKNEVVWVVDAVLSQVDDKPLKHNDNRVKGVLKSMNTVPKTDLIMEFYQHWGKFLSLPANQNQNQNQKQDQVQAQDQNQNQKQDQVQAQDQKQTQIQDQNQNQKQDQVQAQDQKQTQIQNQNQNQKQDQDQVQGQKHRQEQSRGPFEGLRSPSEGPLPPPIDSPVIPQIPLFREKEEMINNVVLHAPKNADNEQEFRQEIRKLEDWKIINGLKRYLDRKDYVNGKGLKYALGICRNIVPEEVTTQVPVPRTYAQFKDMERRQTAALVLKSVKVK
jgi:hypothetical protein